MNTVYSDHEDRGSRHWIASACRGILRLTWHAIRLPSLTLLVLLQPVICWTLSLVGLLGVLTAFFWEFFSPRPYHRFWIVVAISVGVAMLQIPYYLLIRLFSTR